MRPPTVHLGAVGTLALSVVGVAVVATSTYGFVPGPAAAADGSAVSVPASSDGSAQLASATTQGRRVGASGSGTSTAAAADSSSESADADATDADATGEPAFVSIPGIGTTSALIELGLTPDRTLEVPVDFLVAGWYRLGPRPGDPGPAVIAGHLDSYTGPGVFSKLDQVKPGDQVFVTRKDGSSLEFSVTRIDQYPKRAFPTRQVYGPTDRAELRLITCGGTFDRATGSYRSNTVVYASLVTGPGVSVPQA